MSARENKWYAGLVEPFCSGGSLNVGAAVAFVMINALVLANACLHDPRVGYDATEHLKYVQALSQGRLVGAEDSHEFFSPPLPYALPALLMAVFGADLLTAAKVAQLANALASLLLTFYLLKICDLLGGRPALKPSALVCLGVLPVYYKSFSFVRGEPYVAAFGTIFLYHALCLFSAQRVFAVRGVAMGFAMGLAALSRQWAFLLFPAVPLLAGYRAMHDRAARRAVAFALVVAATTAALAGAWFYISLHMRYGATTAFNRERAESFSLGNQPTSFYSALHVDDLFRRPFRPRFANCLLPVFYSEVWGDYWGDFVVYGFDVGQQRSVSGAALHTVLSRGEATRKMLETNYPEVLPYLGRVNAVSLLPAAVLLSGMVAALLRTVRGCVRGDKMAGADVLFLSAIGVSLAGYLWFLIMYPNPGKGDTIKATYMLQTFPPMALLGGRYLEWIEHRRRRVYLAAMTCLGLVVLHNAPAMMTHY